MSEHRRWKLTSGAVQEFFNLDVEHQAETLLGYQNHLAQVVNQNKEMVEMIEKINIKHQVLTTQIDTALKQNAELLKTLKETPDVETITTQIKETLDKEYELKFKLLEETATRDRQVQEENHKADLKKQDHHYDGLLK